MELLNEFGFDIRLLIAQVVNFLVIAYVFKRFLYKPILNTLKKRADSIEKGLSDAEKATKALERAEQEKDEMLGKASKEVERILNEAKASAEETRNSILNDARSEVEKLMKQTTEQIQTERENFAQEAREISLELSKKILEESIKDLFGKKEQEELIKKGIQKIK